LSIELKHPIASPNTVSIEKAILETLAYSDIFDYPLRVDELHRYLRLRATPDELRSVLDRHGAHIDSKDGFYFLAGREIVVTLRQRRSVLSQPLLRRAIRYGHLLGRLPFIRMVALTGSLAVLNCDETADLDYMLVTAAGHVWTARGFAVLLGRLISVTGFTLCPNLIVSEKLLEWRQQDLYSAREICQMIPIAGADVYTRLRRVNAWTASFLPNALGEPNLSEISEVRNPSSHPFTEWVWSGALGDRLENWEMDRKINRLTRQSGFGSETLFSADICQGNFHQHGSRTLQAYYQRLMDLGIDPSFSPPSSSSIQEVPFPRRSTGSKMAVSHPSDGQLGESQ
jgi:hypothetical protein